MNLLVRKTPAAHSRSERRLDQRKPIDQQALIWWEKDQNRRCRITSVSMTGLYLQVEKDHLTEGTVLQVFFYNSIDDSQKLCHEWVRVVGQRDGGVAVQFIRFDNEHQCNIQLMLHQAIANAAAMARASKPDSAQPYAVASSRF